jgi:hypothetical protein
MKLTLLLLLFSLPAFAQDFATKFKEAESRAPKGYPTLFIVTSASISPATLGSAQECGMSLETLGRRYLVVGQAGWTTPCKAFQPGTPLFGHIHQMVDQVVDLVDPKDANPKPKSHRYFVRDITLVDPATQQ